MAYYLVRGTYSAGGYLGLMTNPQDREIATRKLNEQIGMGTVA